MATATGNLDVSHLPFVTAAPPLSHTMLRAAVRKFDKTTRDFGDKDEWKAVLKGLQQDGALTYSEASDTITLSAE